MAIGEFAIIDRFFDRARGARQDVPVGIGDDGAVLTIGEDQRLVTALATAGEAASQGTGGGDAARIGNDVMAAALNRLAAAGAQPAFATLSLTLPEADAPWLAAFSDALLAVAAQANVALVGGDTTRGAFAATVVGHGIIDRRVADIPARVRVGDTIYMSGGLSADSAALAIPSTIPAALGAWIRTRGGVAVDLSEGLESALAALLGDRRLGASVELAGAPLLSTPADATGGWSALVRRRGLIELCFAVDASLHAELVDKAATLATRVTPLARVDDSGHRRLLTPDGEVLAPRFDHWANGFGDAGRTCKP